MIQFTIFSLICLCFLTNHVIGYKKCANIRKGPLANITDHPWAVFAVIHNHTRNSIIGNFAGAIIDKSWVITAWHCLEDFQPKQLHLYVGSADWRVGQLYSALEFHRAEQNPNVYSDIGLIRIDGEFHWSENVQPVNLYPNSTIEKKTSNFQSASWGPYTQDGCHVLLREVKIVPELRWEMAYRDWHDYYPESFILFKSQSILPIRNVASPFEFGDSGAPIVIKVDGYYYIVSVVSLLSTGVEKVLPVVTCKIYKHLSWIREMTGLMRVYRVKSDK